MTKKALRRSAHAARLTSQLNDARRSRRSVATPTGRRAAAVLTARWTTSADGRLTLTWLLQPRVSSCPATSEESMNDVDPRSHQPGARVRRREMSCS